MQSSRVLILNGFLRRHSASSESFAISDFDYHLTCAMMVIVFLRRFGGDGTRPAIALSCERCYITAQGTRRAEKASCSLESRIGHVA